MNRMDFRLPHGIRRNPAVDAWMSQHSSELGSIAQRWFQVMRERGDDVRELMHDGCPVACVDDAPFGYVNAFKAHVNVGFFHGATLPDPARLLEGSGIHILVDNGQCLFLVGVGVGSCREIQGGEPRHQEQCRASGGQETQPECHRMGLH